MTLVEILSHIYHVLTFSMTVFFLLLAEIIPPTSIVVPLLAKYLIFTMFLVVASVIVTVFTYNIHFRSLATHTMPDWMRKVRLSISQSVSQSLTSSVAMCQLIRHAVIQSVNHSVSQSLTSSVPIPSLSQFVTE